MTKAFLFLLVALAMAEVPSTPKAIPDAVKLRIKDAQLAVQVAYTDLLQTPQYSAFQAANANAQRVVAETEKELGCQIDLKTVECKPPAPKAAK